MRFNYLKSKAKLLLSKPLVVVMALVLLLIFAVLYLFINRSPKQKGAIVDQTINQLINEENNKSEVKCDTQYGPLSKYTISDRIDEISTSIKDSFPVNILNEHDYLKNLIAPGEQLERYDYSDNKKLFAYIVNKPGTTQGKGLKRVYLIDSNTRENKVIFEKISEPSKVNPELSLEIRDLAFSNDANTLAITTSTSILLYNINQNNIQTLYDSGEFKGLNGAFAFSHLNFSPDDKKILLLESWYEGGQYMILDVDSREMSPTLYKIIPGNSKRPIGWFNNQLVIIETLDEGFQDGQELGQFKFYLTNSSLTEEAFLFETSIHLLGYDGYDYRINYKLQNNKILLINMDNLGPKEVCYHNKQNRVTTKIQNLYSYDLSQKKLV